MLKREWGAEINGKLPHLLIPSKIATLVFEFAVKDLHLAENTDDNDDIYIFTFTNVKSTVQFFHDGIGMGSDLDV